MWVGGDGVSCVVYMSRSFTPTHPIFSPPHFALADAVADVAVRDGVIVAVGPDLPRDQAAEVFDATGLLVTPGLVDTHVHVYDSLVPLGIDADRHCLGRGSTTVVDAGSAGCNTLAGLKRFAVASQKTRILALLHVASHGLASERTTPPHHHHHQHPWAHHPCIKSAPSATVSRSDPAAA